MSRRRGGLGNTEEVISSQYLASYPERLMAIIERAFAAVAGLDDDEFDRSFGRDEWTTGQIFRHLIKANEPYLEGIGDTLMGTKRLADGEVRHSFFGRFLVSAMQPGKSVLAPKKMIPEPGKYGRKIVDQWREQQDKLMLLASKAKGWDLGKTRFRNPFVPIFPMKLADAFEVILAHTDYHTRQLEARYGK